MIAAVLGGPAAEARAPAATFPQSTAVPTAVPSAAAAPVGADAVAAPSAPVTAAGAVLWDPLDERVLWGRDADVPRPMASTTKIMTTLLAVESGTLDDTVVVSGEAARVGRLPGAASLGLRQGERLAMRALLEGLMLRSGNDAAVAVAEHVAGTEDAFVGAMNARARMLGLDDTHFVDASGLTNSPDHHASPLDLARLAQVALGHPPIARWSASQVASSEAFGTIRNRNELLGSYPGATGVKTGFTSRAGLCLVASAERDGRPLISVVLDSDDHFADSRAVLDHGFADYRRVGWDTVAPVVRWRTSAGATPAVAAAPLGRTVADRVPAEVVFVPAVSTAAAVAPAARVGEVRLRIDGAVVGAAPVRAVEPVVAAGPRSVGAAVEDALRGLARLEVRPVVTASAAGREAIDGPAADGAPGSADIEGAGGES